MWCRHSACADVIHFKCGVTEGSLTRAMLEACKSSMSVEPHDERFSAAVTEQEVQRVLDQMVDLPEEYQHPDDLGEALEWVTLQSQFSFSTFILCLSLEFIFIFMSFHIQLAFFILHLAFLVSDCLFRYSAFCSCLHEWQDEWALRNIAWAGCFACYLYVCVRVCICL